MNVDFLDSNVFIYLFDPVHTKKRELATGLVRGALQDNSACISFQVVQETLRVVTEKLPQPASAEGAQKFFLHSLQPLWRVMPSAELYASALRLKERWKFSFYDALIVAAALEAGCKRLYSEDLQHGQRIEGLRIENPFKGA
jgi:predicted nucleic acid-binding protein